ncbi:VOC family protein [Asanoa sp. NPDC049518]|uniref:VOC family protein n=1 Tax=unclassified Asanoa TaxID=2685164 RepID=UPI0034341309
MTTETETGPERNTRPSDYPAAIIPMLAYENGVAAIEFLCAAFGFTERMRLTADDGSIGHAELALGDAVIALATPQGIGYASPRHHREHCTVAMRWTEQPWVVNGVMIYVDDVDAHAERARAAGAKLLSEPEDQPYGVRSYRVEDAEGHRWMFSQHLHDTKPEDWGATTP